MNMSLKKFNSFETKKNFETECPICLDDIQKDQKVVLTYCCNSLLHLDCNPNEKCPCCRGDHFILEDQPAEKIVVKTVERVVEKKVYDHTFIPNYSHRRTTRETGRRRSGSRPPLKRPKQKSMTREEYLKSKRGTRVKSPRRRGCGTRVKSPRRRAILRKTS